MINIDKGEIQAGHNPLAKGKTDIAELFDMNEKLLTSITLMSSAVLSYKKEECNLPNQNKFFYQRWNRTFLVVKQKSKLIIKLAANFMVEEVKECTLLYNDKSGKIPLKYYLATLKNTNGKVEKDIEVANNSKSDYKQFQTSLNQFYNGFAVNMTEAEFKAFVEKYMSPNIASKLTLYKNAGVISDNKFLYKNALVEDDKILWADNDGYINTGKNTYIRIADATHYLPKLAQSNKTGIQVANELMTNIVECWSDNVVLPLLTLGHMVMSIYYENFVKHYGVPTLLLYGETGTGKSTLVTVGLSIFGLSKEAMTSGGSTAKSNEYFSANYNGINICTDDVKEKTLNSENFITLIKGAYKAIPRTRMLPYGREVEYINICSPLAYSTNEALPDLKEVINRMNVIEIFGKVFKAEKFKYHEINSDNLRELSLILPEFIKIPVKDVLELYEQLFETLKKHVSDTQNRVISNIAFAYTGALLLLSIANVSVEDFDKQIIDYAQKQIKRYESIQTPVDKVLSEIIVLTKLGVLEMGRHFKIADVKYENRMETHIRFHKDVILSAINKFYAHDKSKRINETKFFDYAKHHSRYRGKHSVRFKDGTGKNAGAMCFNISGLYDFADIAQNGICAMSYDELQDSVKGNNM